MSRNLLLLLGLCGCGVSSAFDRTATPTTVFIDRGAPVPHALADGTVLVLPGAEVVEVVQQQAGLETERITDGADWLPGALASLAFLALAGAWWWHRSRTSDVPDDDGPLPQVPAPRRQKGPRTAEK